MMNGYKLKYLLITSILVASIFSNSAFASSSGSFRVTDIEDFVFKQEIEIPFDTSLPEAKYQPIDVRIDFENSCWGKDDKAHSIRVGMDDKTSITELESQVYNIEFSNNEIIASCNLVFLIPENVDGKEKYYVFYDSSEKESANYEKRVEVFDAHYFYEPIPGQVIDVDYYGMKEGDVYVYGVVRHFQVGGKE